MKPVKVGYIIATIVVVTLACGQATPLPSGGETAAPKTGSTATRTRPPGCRMKRH